MTMYHAKRILEMIQERDFTKLYYEFIIRINNLSPRNKRVRIYTYKNKIKNRLLYDAPTRPYATIEITARNVSFLLFGVKTGTAIFTSPHHGGFGQIKDGNWPQDDEFINIKSYHIKKSFEQRFIHNQAWENTPYFKYMIKEKKYGEERVIDIFNYFDKLYQSILNKGYQSNHSGPNFKTEEGYKEKFQPFVVIDDTGELYLKDGRHRLCIAQILDLKIPVHVVCRHKQWQELRDEIHNNGLPEGREDLRDHPDLQDILN